MLGALLTGTGCPHGAGGLDRDRARAAAAQARLIRLRVTPIGAEPVTALEGVAAEEPLHFSRVDTLTWVSLAGIPVEGGDTLPVLLIVASGDRRDTLRTAIAVTRARYPSERLSVDPAMANPDSASEVRIMRELALGRQVGRGAHHSPKYWQAPFVLPRDSRITSRFGTGREYNGQVVSRHLGTDFAGAIGAPVRATNAGRVALVAMFYLAGRVVYLDHGEGLVSAYFHLSGTLVTEGQEVAQGQLIGLVGASGRVTGPHLHWVMRYGAVTVDPLSVVELLGEKGS